MRFAFALRAALARGDSKLCQYLLQLCPRPSAGDLSVSGVNFGYLGCVVSTQIESASILTMHYLLIEVVASLVTALFEFSNVAFMQLSIMVMGCLLVLRRSSKDYSSSSNIQ